MAVGLCGTGKMGAAMAERLLDGGETLTVWNRTRGRTAPLAARGAAVADSPAAVARACDTIITMLIDDDALAAVYEGADGLLAAPPAGRLLVDMSTVRGATTERLAAKVRAAGGAFVACPVGGTVPPARNGQLIGMAGGEAADVARARPLLEKLCRRVDHVGPVAAAAAMKLALNLPMMVWFEAVGEALAIAEHAGIDRAQAVDLLGDSSGASKVAGLFLPGILKAVEGDIPPGAVFEMSGAVKDIRLMAETIAAFGIEAPVAAATRSCYEAAVADGWADRNFPLLSAWRVLRERRA
ncbi:MAG: NAD(P)-dependent oxidoreductase [Alphaproteobacteria bacterium]